MRNKKTVITVTSIVAILLVIIGVTYAYWLVTKTQTNENIISTGCLDISLSGEKNDIELQEQFPMSDIDGMKLTPYEFTVTNNCTTSVDFQVNLESIGDSSNAIKASAIKAVIDEKTPRKLYEYVGAEPTFSGAYESYTLLYGTLASASEETEEDTVTYKLRIWLDEDAPISEQNKSFRSKISVSVGQHITSQGNSLASLILSDAEENNYLKNETPNFESPIVDGEYGLYSAVDDLGTSYYFRGDVENNYVKLGKIEVEKTITYYTLQWEYWSEDFSKNYTDTISTEFTSIEQCNKYAYESSEIKEITEQMNKVNGTSWATWCSESRTENITETEPMYWRIVRINGDGSVRVVYDGSTPVVNGTAHNASIGNSPYNDYNITKNSYDGKYFGYTYDTNEANSNQVDSTIKSVIDKWYEDNLKTDYSKYIADSIFCNDREIYKYEYWDNYQPVDDPSQAIHIENFYAGDKRLNTTNVTPQLTCPNDNDRYTTSKTIGNGYLKYPIGILTADEVIFSGTKNSDDNTHLYLYNAEKYWTMTPGLAGYSYAGIFMFYVNAAGDVTYNFSESTVENEEIGVRPVINLKADVKFTGNGRIDTNTPYELVMD